MANNCVHYGNQTDSLGKSRTKLGSPDLNIYRNTTSNVYAPDCITCNLAVSFNGAPPQCKVCIIRRNYDRLKRI